MTPPFLRTDVADAFAAFPKESRKGVLALRELIFAEAIALPDIGPLQETLKWGQPAYLTPETGAASTLRLGVPKTGGYAIYTHCQSRLMPEFQALFPADFTYEGTRAIHFEAGTTPPDGTAANADPRGTDLSP